MDLKGAFGDLRQQAGRFLGGLLSRTILVVVVTLFFTIVLFLGWVIFGTFRAGILTMIGMILFIVGLFLFAYWYLAKPYVNKWFSFVVEGTTKISVIGDAFYDAMIQWRGFTYDEEYNVVPEGMPIINGEVVPEGTPGAKKYYEPRHPLGGFRYYGIWPIIDILVHWLRWHDIQRTEKGVGPQFHEKRIDYVLLQPDLYWAKEVDVETGYIRTGKMERIAVTVEFLVTMRVVNPKRALFKAPIGYIENSLLKISPLLRAIVTARDLDALLLLKGRGEDIWSSLKETEEIKLIKMLKDEWGIQIDENGIQIWRITPPPEIQKAMVREREEELRSKGRTAKTAGLAMDMFCEEVGMTRIEVQKELRERPREFINKYREVWRRNWDFVRIDMGIEAGAYMDLRTANAITDVAAILTGLVGKTKKKEEDKKDKRDKKDKKTEED